MPRQRRLNVPGALHHVIVRGLERRDIFRDDDDRRDFLKRLQLGLEKTKCQCFAWVLMSNHFHLLIRTSTLPLSDLMRGLLTGYAVAFNRRRKRSGYLFQNRFKSILCQEDTYFLELVRYIHLNPVRAGMVKTLEALDKFPWSGHSALVGTQKTPWQDTDEVLSHFGEHKLQATRGYKSFIQDGWGMGRREDLTGGGLRRSAGGWEALAEKQRNKDYQRGDERILGDGDFVSAALKDSEEQISEKERLTRAGWTLSSLAQRVCQKNGISPEDLRKKGRSNAVSQAKEVLVIWGIQKLRFTQKLLAAELGLSQSALSQIYKRACARTDGTQFNLLS